MFKALFIDDHQGTVRSDIKNIGKEQLPAGNTLIKVEYSSLNYKDGLAVTGKAPIAKVYPMVPGIDLAGAIVETSDSRYQPGQKVLATGWGIGEAVYGGFSEYARLPADYLVPLPQGLSSKDAMVVGTAGFTAMLCIERLLEAGIKPEQGKLIVTGASGGVGSFSVHLAAELGFAVTAVTSDLANADYLAGLGAQASISRSELEGTSRPLDAQRWACGVDTVGGPILGKLMSQLQYHGAVACCGLAGSSRLEGSMMPFILRNISLLGVESVTVPAAKRKELWDKLAGLVSPGFLRDVSHEINLKQVKSYSELITKGRIRGRVIVRLNADS